MRVVVCERYITSGERFGEIWEGVEEARRVKTHGFNTRRMHARITLHSIARHPPTPRL